MCVCKPPYVPGTGSQTCQLPQEFGFERTSISLSELQSPITVPKLTSEQSSWIVTREAAVRDQTMNLLLSSLSESQKEIAKSSIIQPLENISGNSQLAGQDGPPYSTINALSDTPSHLWPILTPEGIPKAPSRLSSDKSYSVDQLITNSTPFPTSWPHQSPTPFAPHSTFTLKSGSQVSTPSNIAESTSYDYSSSSSDDSGLPFLTDSPTRFISVSKEPLDHANSPQPAKQHLIPPPKHQDFAYIPDESVRPKPPQRGPLPPGATETGLGRPLESSRKKPPGPLPPGFVRSGN